ncbi:MAG: ribonuclease III [Ruminococcus sp.]|jgi:ribonuclease-3|nr:ribonuclease III [Ruminococcus sp.]
MTPITLTEFEEKIGYTFKNKKLLENALSHSSYANEKSTRSNERLEFLGDSVLSLIVSEELFKRYKGITEGDLSKIRAALVCESSLNDFAAKISLPEAMLLGIGEERRGGRGKPSMIADAFEAVLAAIYLDAGFETAKKYLLPFLPKDPEKAVLTNSCIKTDYKTIFQEIIQGNREERITYHIVSEEGPPHNRIFKAEIRLNSNVLATGEGRSKKSAEQEAAKEALKLTGTQKSTQKSEIRG